MVHTITYSGKSFEIICNDEFMSNNLSSGKFYEGEMLTYIEHLSLSGIYVDIGAYIGTHSIFFSEICNSSKVIAYEPMQCSYDVLKENTINYSKIEIHNIAIGSKIGKCSMNIVKENTGMSNVSSVETGDISMTTLDINLCNIKNKIDVIKIDVEGYEFEVLKGAHNIIKSHRPHLFIELIGGISDTIIFLDQFNYKIIEKFNATPTYYFKPL